MGTRVLPGKLVYVYVSIYIVCVCMHIDRYINNSVSFSISVERANKNILMYDILFTVIISSVNKYIYIMYNNDRV